MEMPYVTFYLEIKIIQECIFHSTETDQRRGKFMEEWNHKHFIQLIINLNLNLGYDKRKTNFSEKVYQAYR